MSCATPLEIRDLVVDDVARANPVRVTLEQIATLVEDARAARWPRLAETVLDLTDAMAVDVSDAGEEMPAPGLVAVGGAAVGLAAVGDRYALLRPRAGVRIVVSFATEAARDRAVADLRAIERIVAASRDEETRPTTDGAVATAIDDLPLSPRMREVARLVLAGRSDKEIADELGVSHASARSYVQRMCRTLGVSGRGGLLRRVLGQLSTGGEAVSRVAASGRAGR